MCLKTCSEIWFILQWIYTVKWCSEIWFILHWNYAVKFCIFCMNIWVRFDFVCWKHTVQLLLIMLNTCIEIKFVGRMKIYTLVLVSRRYPEQAVGHPWMCLPQKERWCAPVTCWISQWTSPCLRHLVWPIHRWGKQFQCCLLSQTDSFSVVMLLQSLELLFTQPCRPIYSWSG